MNGGLGVYGVITELLIQLTPPTYTALTTIELPDTNMLSDVKQMLKTSPHVLVLWRPDINRFRAFQLSKAGVGSKVTVDATATMLPNVKDRLKGGEVVRLMTANLHDDKAAMELMCPEQVGLTITQLCFSFGLT